MPFRHSAILRLIPASAPAAAVAAALLAGSTAPAQEVRRAVPVDQVPTERAIPIQPFETPTPAPKRLATPAPQNLAPDNISGDSIPAAAAAPPRKEQSADQVQLEYANGFYSRGIVDMAAPEYERYLNLYPDAPLLDRESALFRLGESYRKMGNVNAARNAYQTLLMNYAIGQFIGPAAYRLGDMAYQAKDYEGALNYYRKASVRLSDPTVALAAKFYSARCLEELDLPSEARITYEDIVSAKGDNPYREPSRLALAEILSTSGRKEEARDQFEALAKEATQPAVKVEALVKAGLLNVDLDNPEKAAAELNAALAIPQIGQWKPIAQIGLLRVLYNSGKYKKLLAQYQDAYDTLPDDIKPEVLILAANSKRQIGDFAGASALYQQIIKTYPASQYADDARYQHLIAMYNAGDPNLISAIDEFLAGNPEATKRDQVTLLKGEALFAAHKYADAAQVYETLHGAETTLSSEFKAEAIFKLGWCYMQIQQPDKAIVALSDFLRDYPDNKLVPSAIAQRAVAYQQNHDLTSALKDFNQIIESYPGTKERELALQQKALILGEQQDNDGMAATFKQLLSEFPHSPAAAEANYWIGSAAFSAKDYKASIAPLEKARKLNKTLYFERSAIRLISAYATLGQRDKLAAEIDLYNGNHPKDKVQTDVLRWLGESYLSDKDYTNADKYLSQVVTRPDATPDDSFDLGQAQSGEKNYSAAIESINKYIAAERDPALQAKGYLALGNAQLQSGKLDDAQTSADKACTLQPEGIPNAQGRMLAGDIQLARGNYDAAAKIYQAIALLVDDPQITPRALEKAYDCLIKQGLTADAAKILNQLQTKYPEYQVGGPAGH